MLEATGESASSDLTPMPGRVPDLVEQMRAGGQPIELVEDGEQADMAIGAQLTAYRVVQESLTNAVKYAAGRRTLVRLAHTPGWTDVEVTTAGTSGGAPRPPPSATAAGHLGRPRPGRAAGTGGDAGRRVHGGAQTGGAFRVHARIPTGGIA